VTAAVAPVLEAVSDTAIGVVDSALGAVEPVTAAVAPVLEAVSDTAIGVVDNALSAVEPVTATVAPVLEAVNDTATGVVDSALSALEPTRSDLAGPQEELAVSPSVNLAPAVTGLADLTSDALGSSGSLEFGGAPSSGQENSLFAGGRYTDLGIVLNNAGTGVSDVGLDPTAPETSTSAQPADTDGMGDDEQVSLPAQDLAPPALASATGLIDELGLRGGDGLL
jgi:hypothetical protein